MSDPKKKILVVDDDLSMDKMLVFLFETKGFDVRYASGGAQALEILKDFMPHLIILDLMMPDIDGFEVCRRIKEDDNLKHIPIIALSALPSKIHKDRAMSLGADAYIEKPFVSRNLIDTVEAHLS